ncbi:TnsA endonuclease N-terminal domain-containing protein [Alicyclobacillus sp. SO9]|uniref:TnsA endonuclease N-terminal domain-containing protein n=1 Tax=Alicyclobacillus sp. SO9 TaxID=2665646 RepID=UPI0018E6E413|nr:TnsA endonuclease N-terminal domain-containing protein [Alicyclobacillus sp. SO9]QQE78398.1 heteromeric transposase endonuclease subunit TnsA [Alicyclobacillus sp. SO9]
MAKRKREEPEMQRRGKNQVEGPDYEPYIKVQDIPSLGRSTRTTHPKAPWVGNLLSDIETAYRILLEWSDWVEVPYDQYALEQEETLKIANAIGVEHPRHPKTKEYTVMTSDFVIKTTDGRTVVWSVKAHDKISKRDVEKLEIERIYWTARGASWWLVTEDNLPDVLVTNLKGIRKTIHIEDYGLSFEQVERVCRVAERNFEKGLAMRDLASLVDELLGYPEGTSLTIFRHLIATKRWVVDMLQPIEPTKPLHIVKTRHSESDTRRWAESD